MRLTRGVLAENFNEQLETDQMGVYTVLRSFWYVIAIMSRGGCAVKKAIKKLAIILLVGCIGSVVLLVLMPKSEDVVVLPTSTAEATKPLPKPTDVSPTLEPKPTVTPEPMPTPVPYWISGYDRCPTSEYYGELQTDTAGLYAGMDGSDHMLRMPHGSKVVFYPDESDEKMCRIDYGANEGFVQCMFLVTYDPEGGVQPDESQCW